MLTKTVERRGDCLEPTSSALIEDPLTFLAEDHLRQRQICAMLTAIATQDQPEFRAMGLSLAFLRHEFLLHNADERAGLFPMMIKRCEPEDEIGIIISRVQDDHDEAQALAKAVCETLEGLMESQVSPTPEQRSLIKALAAKCQRYLIWENAIILRLARARLTNVDLAELARQMLLRRGLVEPTKSGEPGI
jgi:hemerythrin-like domain-containing protein